MNLRPGTTPRDIDALCPSDNSYPERENCVGCKREMELDPPSGLWFFTDQCTKPYFTDDYLEPLPTNMGPFCSVECLELFADEGGFAEEPNCGLFLVKKVGRA